MSRALVLVCGICRWRPPQDLQLTLVESHFDIEPDHDPARILLELIAWCHRCDLEMNLDRTEHTRSGAVRRHYSCGRCRRSTVVRQRDIDKAAPP